MPEDNFPVGAVYGAPAAYPTLQGSTDLVRQLRVAPPQLFLQLCFRNVGDLWRVRKAILPLVRRNQERKSTLDAYADASVASARAPARRAPDGARAHTDAATARAPGPTARARATRT